jgi:hypothetical protein
METDNIVTQLKVITPKEAQDILSSSNVDNRNIRLNYVNMLANLIDADEWVVTHQGIAFDKDGRLVDGQHRLLAIVKSGKSTPIFVTKNLDKKTYAYIDTGNVRSQTDIYKINHTLSAFITTIKHFNSDKDCKFNSKEMANIIFKIGPIHEKLVGPNKTRTFTSGSSLAALFYHYCRTYDSKQYLESLFQNLKSLNYAELPKIGNAFHKSLAKRQTSRIHHYTLLLEMLYVYDSSNKDQIKIRNCGNKVFNDFKAWVIELKGE